MCNERAMMMGQARGIFLWMLVLVVIVCSMSESAQPLRKLVGESPTETVPSSTTPQLATISQWNERLVQPSKELGISQLKRRLRTQRGRQQVPRESSYSGSATDTATTIPLNEVPSAFSSEINGGWQKSTTRPLEMLTESSFPYKRSINGDTGFIDQTPRRHPCHRGRHSQSLSTECPSTTTEESQTISEIEKGVPNILIQNHTTSIGNAGESRESIFRSLSTESGLVTTDHHYVIHGSRHYLRRKSSSSSPLLNEIYTGKEELSTSPLVQYPHTLSLEEHTRGSSSYDTSTTSTSGRNNHVISKPSLIPTIDDESSSGTDDNPPSNSFQLTLSTSPSSLKGRDDHLMNYSVGTAGRNDEKMDEPTSDIYSSWTSTLENTKYSIGESFESTSTMEMTTPPPGSKEERERQERSQLERHFKQTHPIGLWRAVGFFDDEFLKSINSHWLQYETASVALHRVLGILYGVLMVVGCGGNLLVILMFIRCRSLRTPPNYLIVNLAISDFLMMVKMPVFIFNSIYMGPALGSIGCKVYGFLGGISGTASIMTLAAIAVDRYTVIVYPLNPMRRTTSARALLMTMGVWLYSSLFASLPLFGVNEYVPEGLLTSCSFDYLSPDTTNRIFVFVFFIAAFVVPLSLIVYSYAKIFRTVRSAERLEMFNPPPSTNGIPLTRESFKYKQEGKKQKTEVKIAVLSCTIIVIWLLAWTPYATVALLGIFGYKRLITPFVSAVPALFCKSAACVNPFIYAINHPRFQRELRAKLPTFLTKTKRASSPDASYYSNASATYHDDKTNALMSPKKTSLPDSSPDEKKYRKKKDSASSYSPVSITFNLHGSPGATVVSRILKSGTQKGKGSPGERSVKDSKADKTYSHNVSIVQTERSIFNDLQKVGTRTVPGISRCSLKEIPGMSFVENTEKVRNLNDCDTDRRNSSARIGESKCDLMGRSETKEFLQDSVLVGDVHVAEINLTEELADSSCEDQRTNIILLGSDEKNIYEENSTKTIIVPDSRRALSYKETNASSRIPYETTIF